MLRRQTTLARGLTWAFTHLSVICVKDYAEHVGGGRFLPPPVPASVAAEQQAIEKFLSIEADRKSHLCEATGLWDLILIDRSVHTLLAHINALERVAGLGELQPAREAIYRSAIPLWPGLVLYLDVSQETITARNPGKFDEDSIYLNPDFNDGIESYFRQLAALEEPRVVWLDASVDVATLRRLAKVRVADWLGR